MDALELEALRDCKIQHPLIASVWRQTSTSLMCTSLLGCSAASGAVPASERHIRARGGGGYLRRNSRA